MRDNSWVVNGACKLESEAERTKIFEFCMNAYCWYPFSQHIFLQAWFMYYIIFYSFKHVLSPCNILGEIEEVWFGGYQLVSFESFGWAQPMRVTKWAKDTGSTSGSLRKSCMYSKFPPQKSFYTLTNCDPKFLP